MRDLRGDDLLADGWGHLLGQAVSPVMSPKPGGGDALPVILGALFGAFAGLLLGLLLVKLVQFAAYLTGRRTEGRLILSLCVAAGTVLGGWLSRPR